MVVGEGWLTFDELERYSGGKCKFLVASSDEKQE